MRVVLATDGSAQARIAEELVWRLDWPVGTTIRVVAVQPLGFDVYGLPWTAASPEVIQYADDSLHQSMAGQLESVVARIRRPGVEVETLFLTGRPASRIVEEARAWAADLVVVGHRGRGTIGTMLLGSVSAEVVDHAPCPVLVAREGMVRSILLATDGSRSARHAEELVERWPMFEGAPVRVVAVAAPNTPWAMGMANEIGAQALEAYTESMEADRAQLRPIAEEAAARLAEAGRDATASVVEGDPAAVIVSMCTPGDGDLVVIGSRGHAGLSRLVLGSVARNVLVHAPASVLVVREQVPFAGSGREHDQVQLVEMS